MIVLRAAPTVEEVEFLLNLSQHDESIAGVVGWLDLADPLQKTHFQRISEHKKFVGFRVMIQDMENPSVILEPAVIERFRDYAQMDAPVDLLVKANQLPVLLKLLEAVPMLRGVVDHIAKPDIANGIVQPWKEQMAEIAKYPNVYCKLSGMVTEADHQNWAVDDFAAYVDHVIDVFGTDRVM